MVIPTLGRCYISLMVFSIREIDCPCTIQSIFLGVYRMMPYNHSFTNGWIGVSWLLRKLKTPTYFSQWKSLPLTHLSNLSILEKTTLPLPLKDTTTLPLFFSPSTSQFDSGSRLFNFDWKLSRALLHYSRTLSIFHYSLTNSPLLFY